MRYYILTAEFWQNLPKSWSQSAYANRLKFYPSAVEGLFVIWTACWFSTRTPLNHIADTRAGNTIPKLSKTKIKTFLPASLIVILYIVIIVVNAPSIARIQITRNRSGEGKRVGTFFIGCMIFLPAAPAIRLGAVDKFRKRKNTSSKHPHA